MLPPGVAAFVEWACGLTAALMSADQSWLAGPAANAIDIVWQLVSRIFMLQPRSDLLTNHFALSLLPLVVQCIFLWECWS